MAPNWDTYPNTHGLTQVLGMSHSIASVFNITEGSFPVERNPTFNCFCKVKNSKQMRFSWFVLFPELNYLFICYRVTFIWIQESVCYWQQVGCASTCRRQAGRAPAYKAKTYISTSVTIWWRMFSLALSSNGHWKNSNSPMDIS